MSAMKTDSHSRITGIEVTQFRWQFPETAETDMDLSFSCLVCKTK